MSAHKSSATGSERSPALHKELVEVQSGRGIEMPPVPHHGTLQQHPRVEQHRGGLALLGVTPTCRKKPFPLLPNAGVAPVQIPTTSFFKIQQQFSDKKKCKRVVIIQVKPEPYAAQNTIPCSNSIWRGQKKRKKPPKMN